jgi:hypothetical protein
VLKRASAGLVMAASHGAHMVSVPTPRLAVNQWLPLSPGVLRPAREAGAGRQGQDRMRDMRSFWLASRECCVFAPRPAHNLLTSCGLLDPLEHCCAVLQSRRNPVRLLLALVADP